MTTRLSEPTAAELKRARQMFREFEKPANYASEHAAEITAAYAGRWVAITAKGVIASSKSYPALSRRLRTQTFRPGELYVKYVLPPGLILIV